VERKVQKLEELDHRAEKQVDHRSFIPLQQAEEHPKQIFLYGYYQFLEVGLIKNVKINVALIVIVHLTTMDIEKILTLNLKVVKICDF
jgi:hypothetical protein